MLSHRRQRVASSTNDLAKGRHVWIDAEEGLCPAERDSEACHHFVEDENGPISLGQLSQSPQEPGVGTTVPMLPTTGSKITAAIVLGWLAKTACNASTSL